MVMLGLVYAVQPDQLLKVYSNLLKSETAEQNQQQDNAVNLQAEAVESTDDEFGSNFQNLVQTAAEIHSHVESGERPPDETLVDTLTMMKNMLAQAQGQKKDPRVLAAQAAQAKQKAVKNIQQQLTQKIMSKLDNDAPIVEVAKKLKMISQYQPQIQDMERRMAILQKVEPILESAIKILTQVVDVKGMVAPH